MAEINYEPYRWTNIDKNMKVRVTAIGEDRPIKWRAHMMEYKKHWWNRWEYVMDIETRTPKLFFYDEDIKFALESLETKIIG